MVKLIIMARRIDDIYPPIDHRCNISKPEFIIQTQSDTYLVRGRIVMFLAEKTSVGLIADCIIIEDIHSQTDTVPVGGRIDASYMECGDEKVAFIGTVCILTACRTGNIETPRIW